MEGLLWAYKAEGGRQRLKALPLTSFKPYRPCLSRAAQSGPRTTGQPLKGLPYFLLNGSSYSLTLNLSSAMSWASCSLMYFAIVASFRPTVDT